MLSVHCECAPFRTALGRRQEWGPRTAHAHSGPQLQLVEESKVGEERGGKQGGTGNSESGKGRKYRGEVTGLAGAKGDDSQPRTERAVRKNKNK